MFEDMDCKDPIEGIVIPRKSLLAIGDDDRQALPPGDFGRRADPTLPERHSLRSVRTEHAYQYPPRSPTFEALKTPSEREKYGRIDLPIQSVMTSRTSETHVSSPP